LADNYVSNIPQVKDKIAKAERLALKEIGEFIAQKAFARCPVAGGSSADGRYTSKIVGSPENAGRLRESIGYKLSRKKGEKYVKIGTNMNEKWSLKVEKGTSQQRAEPYLTPAAEENISEIQAIAARALSLVGEGHSIPEVAESLGVTRAAVYKMIRTGRLSVEQVGRQRFISREEMARLSNS
jgi:HK97 gp10 family phage protein